MKFITSTVTKEVQSIAKLRANLFKKTRQARSSDVELFHQQPHQSTSQKVLVVKSKEQLRRVLLAGRDAYKSGQAMRHTCVMRLIQRLVSKLSTSPVLVEDLASGMVISIEGVCIDSLELVAAKLSE